VESYHNKKNFRKIVYEDNKEKLQKKLQELDNTSTNSLQINLEKTEVAWI